LVVICESDCLKKAQRTVSRGVLSPIYDRPHLRRQTNGSSTGSGRARATSRCRIVRLCLHIIVALVVVAPRILVRGSGAPRAGHLPRA
jgi:hypothetical protein